LKKIYSPPLRHHLSIDNLHQHFAQLDDSLSIDTVFLSSHASFVLIWNELKHFLFSWNIFRNFFQTLIKCYVIFSGVTQTEEQKQNFFHEIKKFLLYCLPLILMTLSFRVVTNPRDWKEHRKWWNQFLMLMALFEGFKFLLKFKSPLVDILGFILFFMHFHNDVSNKLEQCFNALPPQVKIIRFEYLLFHFSSECMSTKIQEKFLNSFFINARTERFIYEYDASYQCNHLSFIGYMSLIYTILTLPKYARLDFSGNDLLKQLTHQQRDRFLNLISSKRHQVILNQNGESDLQRSFLPLLSIIKQKNLPAPLVLNIMGYLIEPQEKALVHYYSGEHKQYIEVLKLMSEEEYVKFYLFIFSKTPRLELNHHTQFLPPFEPKWLHHPHFIHFFKENDKEGFDEFSTDLTLNKLLNRHPIAQKYFS